MALRYLACAKTLGPPSEFAPHRSPSCLQPVFHSEELSLFANEDVILLPGGQGAIVGHLFTRDIPARRVTKVDQGTAERIIATQGKSLLSDFWGGYVAFILLNGTINVIRDPSGALPCYYSRDNSGFMFSSDVGYLIEAGASIRGVDWDGLFLHLAGIEFKRTQTALIGVSELLAGYGLDTRAPTDTKMMWTPWDFVRSIKRTESETTHELKTVIESSVCAWADCFPTIGVSLSGGLDSSIVVAALRHRAGDLILLNFAANDAEGDERHFARLAAEAIGAPLNETFYDPRDVDFTRSTSAYLPRPIYTAMAMADIAVKARLDAMTPIGVWMSGLGGDNVFCIMNSALSILDRLAVEGPTPAIFRTFGDVLRLTGRSIPEILQEASRAQRRYKGRYNWTEETEFLSKDRLLYTPVRFDHPWLCPPTRTPIGKVEHVAGLLRIQGSIDGFERSGPPLINPLLSQPIVEACLPIPTWQWIAGGRNRSIARQAFSDVLPARLLSRRSKGGPNGFAYRLMNANRAVLKDLLIGGILSENGIIERSVVASLFKEDMPLSVTKCFFLSFLAEAETWCRHWQTRAG